MRIIGGDFRGRRLRAPGGRGTRPTPDRVREALFSILGDAVVEARVAELFGGTGSLGLEALSRGAARAHFTETGRAAFACLEANVRALGVEGRCVLLRHSAFALPRLLSPGTELDIVFCDPPYRILAEPAGRSRVAGLLASLPLAPGGVATLEHRADSLSGFLPPGMVLSDLRRWGSTAVAFFRRAP